ncbi:hypothetical protein GWN26_04165 [Candidatus Saccharibacteria bacterium]|nr:hypothetical protein [Candidatus Saccharibacteria bacterium]
MNRDQQKRHSKFNEVTLLAAISILITLKLTACSPEATAFLSGFAQGYAGAKTKPSQKKLMLFGGRNNKIYLGCLNCGEYSRDSIFNAYGSHGNKYSATSIWNSYGEYGSKYSDYSPWNPYASDPPVIVDQDGNFYGYFTVNQVYPQRTKIEAIVQLLDAAGSIMQ